jgi:glycoside hydrolase-like protein/lipase (class 3)
MPALMRQIALVSESELIPAGDVSKVAAAIQKQATRDLSPIWEINATIDVFARLEDVPVGYWSVIARDDIDDPSAAGIHEDENGQPFALVTASSDINVWSITASHEALEMLVDPSGNRLVAADSKLQGRRVNYLVEVCDPSEAAEHAYSCNGILVSDFYTPNYFDPVKAGSVRYSFTGAISEPLQVLRGGYLSWQDPESNSWWQETWFDGASPKTVRFGPIDQRTNGNVRAVIDRATMSKTIMTLSAGRKQSMAAGLPPEQNQVATTAHARNLRARIGKILGRSPADRPVPEPPLDPAAEPESLDVVAAVPRVFGEGPAPRAGAAQPFDPLAAVQYGLLIEAVYSMYYAQESNPTPPPQPDFPTGFRLVAWVQMNDFALVETSPQFYGVIAQSVRDPTKFVLALRGTESPIEWFDNFTSIIKVPFRVAGCGSISYGFNRIYDTMEVIEVAPPGAGIVPHAARSLRAAGSFSKQTAALVRRHAPAQGRAVDAAIQLNSIDVTAHSLGGALVTLYVLENAKDDKIPNQVLYTFASPMVGDATFAAAFDALGLTSWRIVNEPDLVPKAPGEILGYKHIGVEQAYDSTWVAQANPSCWHAMATYLALIDRTRKPDPDCQIQAAAAAPDAARVAVAPLAAAPPTMPAIDTNINVTTYLPTLAAADVKAVGRYYSISTSKVLTQMEAEAITNAGLSIFVVYEDGNDPTKFNANLGTFQAQQALICAREVGQPQGSAIYFAVDFDCTAAQFQQQITQYFIAISAVFAAQGFPYKIGVYSSGLVCQGLLAAGLCSYTWLTNSTGFQGYNQFYASKRWNLAQHLPRYYGKLQADPNEAAGDFGAFKVGTSALAAWAALQPAGGAFEEAEAVVAEVAAPAPGAGDGGAISNLLAIASNPQTLQAAQAVAAQRLLVYDAEKYPQDGCAITLSVLLQEAGVNVPDTYMAIDICRVLQSRGWTKIAVADQQKGDVGSTCGAVAHHGTDHVYVVLRDLNLDEMVVADNQEPAPHFRFASGKSQSPTTYFLRAPNVSA